MDSLAAQAFFWGIVSALSLPAGALLGLAWRPGARISSGFMAFGAGALLFALSIELLGHVPHHVDEHGLAALAVAVTGAIVGGLLFDLLNQLLNNRGAFLRNLSNAKNYVARTKKARAKRLLRRLSRMRVLRDLQPQDVAELVKLVRKERYRDGATVYNAGDRAREIHFVRRGHVDLIAVNDEGDERRLMRLGKNDTFGELAALGVDEYLYTARAAGPVELYTLEKDDLERLQQDLPQLGEAIKTLAETRLQADGDDDYDDWQEEVSGRLDDAHVSVSEGEIRGESAAAAGAAGAAMAIWLGIAIDGVPESVVIGTLAIGPEGMSLAFIVGVFLANMPEAMSSAVSMRRNGMSKRRILFMWSSLCLLTGVGALLAASFFPPQAEGLMFYVKLGIEALAAGAMLTMIAETMLPEAFEQGGSITGIATLCGFLAALSVAAWA